LPTSDRKRLFSRSDPAAHHDPIPEIPTPTSPPDECLCGLAARWPGNLPQTTAHALCFTGSQRATVLLLHAPLSLPIRPKSSFPLVDYFPGVQDVAWDPKSPQLAAFDGGGEWWWKGATTCRVKANFPFPLTHSYHSKRTFNMLKPLPTGVALALGFCGQHSLRCPISLTGPSRLGHPHAQLCQRYSTITQQRGQGILCLRKDSGFRIQPALIKVARPAPVEFVPFTVVSVIGSQGKPPPLETLTVRSNLSRPA